MNRLPIELHIEVVGDARAARAWYAERSRAAADGFVVELKRAVAAIKSAPELWPKHVHGTRRYAMKRYPYVVVYRVESERVLVVAVAHTKRRAGFWRNRLK